MAMPAPTVETAVQTTVANVEHAARDHAIEQVLQHTTSVVSVPARPTGDGDASAGLLPPLPPSPRTEIPRQMALVTWQHDAAQLIAHCLPPSAARERTDLTVFFAPRSRDPADPVQVLTPRWIQLPPEARHRLDQAAPAVEVQACLDRIRSLPLSVRLTGDALAHEVPASAERLSFEL